MKRLGSRTKARFARFAAQKEGAKILLEELRKQWGVEILYDPEFGLLGLPKGEFRALGDDQFSFIPFGKAAAHFENIQKDFGGTPEQALVSAIRSFHRTQQKLARAMAEGSKVQFRKKDGSYSDQFGSLEEMNRYMERQSEIDEDGPSATDIAALD